MSSTKISLALILLASGCLGSTPDIAVPENSVIEPLETIPLEAADCQAMIQLFAVESALLSPYLPSGYHTTDLSNIIGLDVASGQAGLATLAFRCREISEIQSGGWMIFVEAPQLTTVMGLEVDAVHGYMLEWLGQNDTLGAVLDTFEVNRTATFFSWDVAAGSDVNDTLRSLQRSIVETIDGQGQIFTATNYGAITQEIPFALFTLWSPAPNGTFGFQFEIAIDDNLVDRFSTGLAECTMREGTPIHQILGRTSCAPGQTDPVGDIANLPTSYTVLDYHWAGATAKFARGQFEA